MSSQKHYYDFLLPRIKYVNFSGFERMLDLTTMGRKANFLVPSFQLFYIA